MVEVLFSISNPHMTKQMIRAYQEEYRSLKKSLEGKESCETFKPKIRLFQQDDRKKLLIFEHANVEASVLHVLGKKARKVPGTEKTSFLTTERRGTLLLNYLT
jgi:hypothetical protein